MKKKKNPNQMSMREHTSELRKRLSVVLFIFFLSFIVVYNQNNVFFDLILKIGKDAGYNFTYISPQEILLQQLKIIFTFSFFFTFPFFLYEILCFISPVFNKNIKIIFLAFSIIFIFMFLIGVFFSYKILLPFSYKYLYNIGLKTNILAQISVEKYISFFLTIIICMGFVFEMPIICIMLVKMQILNYEIMKKCNSFIIVIIFIIAAIITPPDVVSQLLVAIPMLLLYQISLGLVYLISHRKSCIEQKQ